MNVRVKLNLKTKKYVPNDHWMELLWFYSFLETHPEYKNYSSNAFKNLQNLPFSVFEYSRLLKYWRRLK